MGKDICKALEQRVTRDFPDYAVKMGENWQVIAEIFYKLGYEDAQNREKPMEGWDDQRLMKWAAAWIGHAKL